MKINEQLHTHYQQTQDYTANASADFERFIGSPTGNASGDEYYLLHQNQLQHSCLNFTARARADKSQQQQAMLGTPCSLKKEEATLTISAYPKNLSQINEQEQILQTRTAPPVLLIKSIPSTQTPRTNGQVLIHEPTALKPSAVSKPQLFESHPLLLSATMMLKKHHLFVEGKEAELSINMEGLNKEEQKELTHIISEYVQQKNLILKQLIINGVIYD